MDHQQLLDKMRQEWDGRARENAHHYIANCKDSWSEEEFYLSGEQTLREEILTDMGNICQGADPKHMRVLEIGCGAGRATRAFAGLFGEVHALDESAGRGVRANQELHNIP